MCLKAEDFRSAAVALGEGADVEDDRGFFRRRRR
jgi:hypothetical protein